MHPPPPNRETLLSPPSAGVGASGRERLEPEAVLKTLAGHASLVETGV
jgi:hypothetical protein